MGWMLNTLKYITVEPIILLFFWSIPYIDHGNGVLLFNYFCGVDFNKTFCEDISKPEYVNSPENHMIQGQVSRWIMYSKIAMVLPMLYSTTILGAISDRFQRKLPMLLPAAGIVLGCFWLMGLALIPDVNVSAYFLVSSFLFGITGYYGAALMATSAYLGVMTTAKSRTWRISVYEAALTLGLVAGTATSGLIIDHAGVATVYGITAGLNLLAMLYTMIRIVETHTVKAERPLWHELCEFSHVKEYLRTVYKARSQNRRLYIHAIFAAFMVGTCASQGLYDVLFLYLTKSRSFTNSLFSLFTGAQATITCFGNIVAMFILKTKFNLSEPTINTISALGTALSYSMIAATDSVVIWASLSFMLVQGLGGGACRGFLSKLVPHEEQGQVFAFVAMGQCMTGLIASVIFNNIYPHSLGFWDGLCPFIAGLLNIVGVVLAVFVFIHRKMKNHTDESMQLLTPDASSLAMAPTQGHDTFEDAGSSDDEEAYCKNSISTIESEHIKNPINKSSYGTGDTPTLD